MPRLIITFLLAARAAADVYLNHPRGSNNKLNEQSNNANNQARLFDSQNNAAGGYQVGDDCIPACNQNGNYNNQQEGAGQGRLKYYAGSHLRIEWTSQHGCGAPGVRCEHVLQYACEDSMPGLRDGYNRGTIPDDPEASQDPQYGQHETYEYYQHCKTRERNKGLFTADQNMGGRNTARHTRQDNNGNRRGFECPEERDYYPYWHPSPWRDVAVLVDDESRCDYYKAESQNVKGRHFCSNHADNNRPACATSGADWLYENSWGTKPPKCVANEYARPNHHDQQRHYEWKIPEDVKGTCVLRLRYNISTYDFNPWKGFGTKKTDSAIDASYNGGQLSPVKTDPQANFVGLRNDDDANNHDFVLRLNVDTSQYGRTFEDRTHTFEILDRPKKLRDAKIYNLGVRGRRGNIVQVYPSVEYDFVPQDLTVTEGDYVHFQWTGSDANQGGNAGNGRGGTDRTNLVEVTSLGVNYPYNFDYLHKARGQSMFDDLNTQKRLAYLDQTGCNPEQNDPNALDNCKDLNRASAYFDAGPVRMRNPGTYQYVSTRNNDFSNREMKGSLTVKKAPDNTAWVAATAATGAVALLAVAGLATYLWARRSVRLWPESRFATSRLGKRVAAHNDWCALDAQSRIERAGEKSRYGRFMLWWLYSSWPYVWGLGYALACAAIYAWGAATHASGAEEHGPYYAYAKGAGKVLDFLCALVFVPMCRNLLTYLRTTELSRYLPLNDAVVVHRVIGMSISLFAGVHIGCHLGNASWKAERGGRSVARQLQTFTNVTGLLIAGIIVLMSLTALERVRRSKFNLPGRKAPLGGHTLFWVVHHAYVPMVLLTFAHAKQFWIWALWPLTLFVTDKLISRTRAKLDVTVVRIDQPSEDVIQLRMRLASGKVFKYKPGQYLYLQVPEIDKREWHPFTISSTPEERAYFSVHVRCRRDMDWTSALKRRLNPNNRQFIDLAPDEECPRPSWTADAVVASPQATVVRKASGWWGSSGSSAEVAKASPVAKEAAGAPSPARPSAAVALPVIKVDGPYGAPCEQVMDYSVLILVGAGIGITPFASILKTIAVQKRRGTLEVPVDRVFLNWVCRDVAEFASFSALLDDLRGDESLKRVFSLNTFLTGELSLDEVPKVQLEGVSQYAGRPNWNRIFPDVAKAHEGKSVGVFLCGPSALRSQLARACSKFTNHVKGTKFTLHAENF
mmetsp:Transcript_4885/g.14463  ORF Transcript_4885/g.14463 Transcript_4885/m.14463 type:complete len:1190 (-) Transcript_4885:67-3636(-)